MVDSKKHKKWAKMAVFLVIVFIVSFAGAAMAFNLFSSKEKEVKNKDGVVVKTKNTESLTTMQIVDLAQDAVVEIKCEVVGEENTAKAGQTVMSAGSGVVWREDGYIATNAHVVDGAKTIKVTLRNKNEYIAELVGKDESKDVALLRIAATGLTPVEFGNSDNLKVGERVVVIGNALGTLGGSATDGIVSAVDRHINISGHEMTLVQTNAEINPGNSGGGMFCEHGQFVGMIVAGVEDGEGLGFAIPSVVVRDVVNRFI